MDWPHGIGKAAMRQTVQLVTASNPLGDRRAPGRSAILPTAGTRQGSGKAIVPSTPDNGSRGRERGPCGAVACLGQGRSGRPDDHRRLFPLAWARGFQTGRMPIGERLLAPLLLWRSSGPQSMRTDRSDGECQPRGDHRRSHRPPGTHTLGGCQGNQRGAAWSRSSDAARCDHRREPRRGRRRSGLRDRPGLSKRLLRQNSCHAAQSRRPGAALTWER